MTFSGPTRSRYPTYKKLFMQQSITRKTETYKADLLLDRVDEQPRQRIAVFGVAVFDGF